MEEMTHALLDEHHILLFLVQFFLLLSVSRLLGILFNRIRQPTVTADVLTGLILGPSILGRILPDLHAMLFPSDPYQVIMLDTVSWIGIFFLLLVTGLEVNFSSVWKHRGRATWIAFSDIVIPIVISAIVLMFLPSRYMINPQQRFLFVIFISTIMTISAMPVSIRVMQDLKLLRTDLGFLAISALSINDIVGWILFTVILGAFIHGSPDIGFVLSLIFFTVIFLIFAATAGKVVIGKMLSVIQKMSSEASGPALSVVLAAGLLFGALTQLIGINALFGFFIAGLVAGESLDLPEKTRHTIEQVVNSVFIPIFFADIGLKIDLFKNFDLFLITLFAVLGIMVRFLGTYAGALIAKIPKAQHLLISALHTPGGEMHIVIANLALELRLINETVFVAIIVSAIISTLTLGPMLSFIIKRVVPQRTVQIPLEAALDVVPEAKYDVLKNLCNRAAQIINFDTEKIYTYARGREEGMSTGLEKGIAIPHARVPQIKESSVIFGRSQAGIEWDTPDGLPAKLIFLIVTPSDQMDTQLQIYRQIMRVLSKNEYRQSILNSPSLQSAVGVLNEGLRLTAIAG
jgi:Kef-type K+ transport system membrane component KefB/mannitol/fructose-specific phosphotransferase system IIA component (Ntr-type)